tara:strand:- start:3712 stop:4485 length:774 start_codon:yes stop_codon:yes gene_type:complete
MNKSWKKGLKITGGILVGVTAVAAAPFTGGGSLLAGASALGLGSAAAIGSAVAAGAAGGILVEIFSEDENGNSIVSKIEKGIVIVGPSGSGKTTIYNFLKGENKTGETSVSDYEQFEYIVNKTRTIIIRKGTDFGGGTGFINKYYHKMLKDLQVDYCFFVFNVNKYINEINYQRDVNARLDFIFRKNILDKKLRLIGSFIDKFPSNKKDEIDSKIRELIKEKTYKSLFDTNFFSLLNLTDNSSLKQYLENEFITKNN